MALLKPLSATTQTLQHRPEDTRPNLTRPNFRAGRRQIDRGSPGSCAGYAAAGMKHDRLEKPHAWHGSTYGLCYFVF